METLDDRFWAAGAAGLAVDPHDLRLTLGYPAKLFHVIYRLHRAGPYVAALRAHPPLSDFTRERGRAAIVTWDDLRRSRLLAPP